MRFRRFRFVPQVDCLARRIVLDGGAAAVAIPMIADAGSQDGSSATGDGSNGSGSVDPSANTGSASEAMGTDSTGGSAVDSALDDLLGPDTSDDSEFDPNSSGVMDDSESTSAIAVSGCSAY
jgi:hypothetical protein